jgi:hypothetical protein
MKEKTSKWYEYTVFGKPYKFHLNDENETKIIEWWGENGTWLGSFTIPSKDFKANWEIAKYQLEKWDVRGFIKDFKKWFKSLV